MGNTSQQPPDDWPPPEGDKDMAKYKDDNSPLLWRFTDEQNRRKLKWFERISKTPSHKITMQNFVRSFIMSDIIRREWYTRPELKRKPKLKDLNYLIHPDKAISPFRDQADKYGMPWEEIQKLHAQVFSSIFTSPDIMIITLILDRG